MKQLTINVPDNKYDFIKQLIQELEFVHISEPEVLYEIPQDVQNMVIQRMEDAKKNPDTLLSQEDIMNFLDTE